MRPLAALGRTDRLALLGLTALVLWLFRAALAGGVYHKRDISLVWHPQVETLVRVVASGALPLWDSSISFGQPLLADPSAQALYPFTWLNLVLRPWTAYTLFAFAHVLLAGAGMFALARRWGLDALSAATAGSVWMLSGPYLSLLDLWHHLASASWMPLVLLAADAALERRSTGAALAFGAALGAQMLAGSAEMCALTLVAVALLVVPRRLERPLLDRRNAGLLFACAAALAVAMALSAGQWMTGLEVVRRAARRSLPFDVRTYWSVHPLGMLETLAPGLWSTMPLDAGLRSSLYEAREPFLGSLYMGAPALALVGAAFAAGRDRRRWWLLAVGGASLLVALGKHAPVYGALVRALPPLEILRYPVKVMVLAAFCWSLLAGLGVAALRAARPAPSRFLGWVAAPLLAVIAFDATAALLALRPPPWVQGLFEFSSPVMADLALRGAAFRLSVGATVTAAALALAFAWARRPRPWVAPLLAGLTVADLAAFHRHPNPVAPRALYTHRPEVLALVSREPGGRLYVYDYGTPGPSWSRLGGGMPYLLERMPVGWTPDAASALGMQLYMAPQVAGRWGLSRSFEMDYRGLFPPFLRRLAHGLREAEGTPAHLRLLRAGGVGHVVTLHAEGFEDLTAAGTLPGLFQRPIRVYSVPDPLPRAYAVTGARHAPDHEAVAALADPGFDLAGEVLLPPAGAGPAAGGPAGAAGRARVIEERSDHVVVEAELDRPGYVVLLDAFDPGWRARLDGRDVPILRANLAFRAVHVPVGRHRLEFRYTPPVALAALSVSAVTAIVLAGTGLRQLARRRSA